MPIVIGALKRLDMIRTQPELREKLWTIVHALQKGYLDNGFDIGGTQSCVTPVVLPGTVPEGTNLAIDLRENHDIFCSLVIFPVIPRGILILRIIPTAAHTLEDVEYTINAFKTVKKKLDNGDYKSDTMPVIRVE